MEERKFFCGSCKKEISFFEVKQLPGEDMHGNNRAQNYCKNCYQSMLGLDLGKIKISSKTIIDKYSDIFDKFFILRQKRLEIQKEEKELNTQIKEMMIEENLPLIKTEKFDLVCYKSIIAKYYKKDIEEIVPKDILDKVRTLKEVIYLRVKSIVS